MNANHCLSEQHLNLSVNFSFSEVTADKVASMIHHVAMERPEAIVTFCTNLRAAPLVDELEKELGIPTYDTVAAVESCVAKSWVLLSTWQGQSYGVVSSTAARSAGGAFGQEWLRCRSLPREGCKRRSERVETNSEGGHRWIIAIAS